MKKTLFYLLLLCHADKLIAQNVQVNIDVLAGRKAVSPYIYGRNGSFV